MEPLKGQFFDLSPAKTGRTKLIFAWMKDYARFVFSGVVILVVLTVASAYARGREVISESSTLASVAYEDLQEGAMHLIGQNQQEALASFMEAEKNFRALEKNTAFFTDQARTLIGQSHYLDTANMLMDSALLVTDIGKQLTELFESIKQLPDQIFAAEGEGVMELIHHEKDRLESLIQTVVDLQQKLAGVHLDTLPEALSEKVAFAQEQIGLFLTILLELRDYSDQILTLMGDRVPHRYLILLQNNHEVRATGGFIGSYMIVDINDSKITKMESRDIYGTDGQLSQVLPAPPGIDLIADRLFMRDANYSPDFPTSAQQIMWFLEASRGPSVDTVIAITQTPVEEALAMVDGEIQLEGIPTSINAENFSRLISFYTEAKLSETNTPKQLLFDLIPIFKEKLETADRWPELFALAKKMAQEGHIQVYSRDPGVQSVMDRYNLSGRITPAQEGVDYLSVISTSIGGNKSDEYIETDLSHQTQIDASGQLTDTLVIQKEHTYGMLDRLAIQELVETYGVGELTEGTLRIILGEGDNLDYMRVYVPKGSQLISTEGIDMEWVDISEDLGYTVFGFVYGPLKWGDMQQVKLTYTLPFDLNFKPIDDYRFIAQRQAGVENLSIQKEVLIDESLHVEQSFPESQDMPTIDQAFDKAVIYLVSLVKK